MSHHLPSKPTLLAILVSVLCAPPLYAADNTAADNSADQSAATSDETVEVLGQTYRNTATKTKLTPEETPQAISVVDSETLEQRGVSSVSEALRYVPGVNTELRGGAVSRLDLFNIRGFDNYQNSYDGLLLQYNGWNLQPQIDPIAIEQVEVFKGPTSVLYGSMPPGGMVNLIAKAPRHEAITDVSVATGTGNLKETTLDSSGELGNPDVTYRLVGLARQKDGQANTSEQERYVFAPSVDWQVTDKTLVNVNLYYQKDPAMGIYTTVPASGSVYSNAHGDMSADTFLGDKNWNHYDKDVTLVGYKINHEFGNGWAFLQNARLFDGSAYQRNTYNAALNSDGRTVNRNAYITDEESRGIVVDNQLSGLVTLGQWQHNLLLGVDYQRLHSTVGYLDTIDYSAGSIDIFNPNNSQLDGDNLTFNYQDDEDIRQSQTGFYLQDQLRFDRLVLIAGGRFDLYRADTDSEALSYSTPIKTHSRIDQQQFTWRSGALYELGGGFSPYVSYAESFEPVAGIDKHGDAFKPSTAKQWEGGVKYLSDDGSKTATLAAFHITKENSLVTDPDNVYGAKLQTGETVSKGIELEGRWDVTDQFNLAANYTRLHMEITRDTTALQGKTPVWVPNQTASLWANYRFERGLVQGVTLGSGLRYVGEAEIDAMNTGKVPDYVLLDASVRYDLSYLNSKLKGAEAVLTATNLFDKEYYSCYDTSNCWFGAERNIEARLKYRF